MFIDGYSQPGASAGTVLIELDGANAGLGVDGLTLTGNGSYVRGLAVNSFKGNGVVLQGSSGGQVLAGNRIGTGSGGNTDEGNGAAGVHINGAPEVVIRENLVSGNTTHGIHISGSRASGAVVYGNTIGLNTDGASDLGNRSAGVYIDGASYAALRDNVISGNGTHGVSISGSGATGALVEYNRIGTNADGDADVGNTGSGVHISGTRNVGIYENTIGGNDSHGISLTGSSTRDNLIAENYIGTNASDTDLGNSGDGGDIGESARENTVEDNTIANNVSDGVHIGGGARDNTVEGNTIANNVGDGVHIGESARENTVEDNTIANNVGDGVHIGESARDNTVEGNTIANNVGDGVHIGESARDNTVEGNTIANNVGDGVHIGESARDNTVEGNTIANNDGSGIRIGGSARDNTVEDNTIANNGGDGVHIGVSARDNTVEGNTIANSGGNGLAIISNGSIGNTVWENSIHTDGGLCIDLGDNDVTANDDEDTDSGPNSLQNFPTNLTLATRDGVASARFSLEVTANRVYIIDYYSSDSCDSAGNGEGKQWLGFTPALGSRTGNLAFTASTLQRSIGSYSAPTGTHITATATDAETNSTSEFSTCIAPVALPALVISVDTVEATEDAATAATYTVALPSAPVGSRRLPPPTPR